MATAWAEPMTVQEVARALGVSRFTVYDLIKRGDLPAFRVGNRLRVEPRARGRLQAGRRRAERGDAARWAGRPPRGQALQLDGEDGAPRWRGLADLRALGATTATATRLGAHSFTQHRYTGVLLHDLLVKSGLVAPGRGLAGALSRYVLAVGGTATRRCSRWARSTRPTATCRCWSPGSATATRSAADEGPLLLVVPSDHRGGRYVRGLARLAVRDGLAQR